MEPHSGYFLREEIIKGIRAFFDEQQFHEVTGPVLTTGLPVEPNIYPFSTTWNTVEGARQLFLSTSPESGIKKMLAAGVGNAYALGKCFRNLENSGTKHNPEFLMLEWYRQNSDYSQIMRDVQALVLSLKERSDLFFGRPVSDQLSYQGIEISLGGEWPVLSLVDLCKKHLQANLEDLIDDKALMALCTSKGYATESATWSQLFDQLFLNEIEAFLPLQPYFLIDFPARMSPLCKINSKKPYLAERFEFAIAGMEMGNGNNENTDADKIQKLFEKEAADRSEKHLLSSPIDEDFLSALRKMNSKPYAGIGVGVDRLTMLFADTENIRDVEFFSM